ncbi:hypothetical protein BBK82_03630 [Lentzea guizhouensis]|uniref:Uncharacterized protein n=1 Tax=Lentzea guizhouensis TaxID=1586287 RepID=A0A1B2HC54_9PSEU|nr:hypothetical protein [Lentzea guizhouensis]ANZ35307.1 hypothetical protein BBK82_03630 [Lentzea guizhouensis]
MNVRAWLALIIVVAVVLAANDSPDETAPTVTDQSRWLFTEASCDENDTAFNVKPDTPEAWSSAQDWCIRSGEAINNLPWPSGFKPTTIPEGVVIP